VQAVAPVDVDIEERVEEVEAGHPRSDRAAELPRLERKVPVIATSPRHRRQTVDGAEPEVAEPGDALEVRIR
jgi:hypothetical protein